MIKPTPGPMIKPTQNAELAPLIAELIPESIKGRMSKGASMSGMCIIYEEYFSMPGESAKNNFENINLYRLCNPAEIVPYDFYSTMVTNSTSMTICSDDMCNFSSGAFPTFIAAIVMLFSLIF